MINEKVQAPRPWRNRVRAIFHQATFHPKEFVERLDELRGLKGVLSSGDGGEKSRAAADLAIAAVADLRRQIGEERRE